MADDMEINCLETSKRQLSNLELNILKDNLPLLNPISSNEVFEMDSKCFCIYYLSFTGKNYCTKPKLFVV